MAKDNAIYSNNLNDKMHKKVINANKNAKKKLFLEKTLGKMGHKKRANIFIISCLLFFPI
jgi:hypothetical protein